MQIAKRRQPILCLSLSTLGLKVISLMLKATPVAPSSDTVFTDFPEHRTFRSDHPAGANFCFADGSVHFVSDSIAPDTLDRFVTRDGSEVVSLP